MLRRLGAGPIRIEVDGHADSSGPAELNRRISAARARAVAAVLVEAGVDPSRIEVRAHGEEQPSETGEDRRVEVVIRGPR
jgi:OOP family OmpA-OmpF porin